MLVQPLKSTGTLLENLDAMRNWRAIVLLLITFVLTALIVTIGAMLGQTLGILFPPFALLALVVLFYGANAVGMMMMDEAQGWRSRPPRDALMASLVTSHRLIAVLLLILASYLLGALVLAFAVLICRLPGLGPLLYGVVFPVGVLSAGLALFALPTVIFPLAAPAVWSGASTLASVGQLSVIARKRLLLVLMLMIAVSLLAVLVAAVVATVLMGGSRFMTWLSTAVLAGGASGPLDAFGLDASGLGGMVAGGLEGHASTAWWGGGLLSLAAMTLPALVYLRGASMAYLRAVEGLDLQAEAVAFDDKVAAAKSRARELQAQAQATAQRYARRQTHSDSLDPGMSDAPVAAATPVGPASAPVPASAPATTAPTPTPTPTPSSTDAAASLSPRPASAAAHGSAPDTGRPAMRIEVDDDAAVEADRASAAAKGWAPPATSSTLGAPTLVRTAAVPAATMTAPSTTASPATPAAAIPAVTQAGSGTSSTRASAVATDPPPVQAIASCPACDGDVAADDDYCVHCGHKLIF